MSDNTFMDSVVNMGCGCSSCGAAAYNPDDPYYDEQTATATSYNYSLVSFVNGTLEDAVDSLFGGSKWATNALTFSFPNSTGDYSYSNNALNGFVQMSTAQQEVIRFIYEMVEGVSSLTFTELTGASDRNADLMHAHSSDPSTAYAYYPHSSDIGGDSFYGASVPTNHDPLLGTYQFHTIAHEIGHSLGLKHGHEATGPGATPAQYRGQEFSIMTYLTDTTDVSADAITLGTTSYPQSLMMLDVAALQQMYGANFSANSGNTVYTFSTTTGAMSVNGTDVLNGTGVDKSGNVIFRTIWDGNGTDTYNFSNFSTNLSINLNPGEYSDLDVGGNSQRALLDWRDGDYAQGHIYNALQYDGDARSLIENAIGGSGNDSFIGNAANNVLDGGAGNDTFYASSGNDTITGGIGTDTLVYTTNIANFFFSIINSATISIMDTVGSFGTDIVSGIESFIFNSINYTWDNVVAMASPLTTYDYAFRVDGSYVYNTTQSTIGTQYLTAEQLGYDGATGNMARFVRDVDELTITIQNTNAPQDFLIYGKAGNDVIRIEGVHSNFNVIYNGNNGDDTLVIANLVGNDLLYGGNGDDVINGGHGNDKIYGQADDDTLYGGFGDDTVLGGSGNDVLHGGDGNDLLYGEDGDDTINGDAGNDRIWGAAGADLIYGGGGDDTIYGGGENDTLHGGGNNDFLIGGDGDDILNGDDGHDRLQGDGGHDTINGGAGDDLVYGGAGNDIITGGLGADRLIGEDGNDTISGDDGNDRIWGEAGEDILNGGDGNDAIYGGADNDTINGDAGQDFLYGDDGDDLIYGGADNDRLYGGSGNDTLHGDDGNDVIFGATNNDTIYGGNGDDYLYGENGNDILHGGTGTNFLYGESGADELHFGLGLDTLIGGDGADRFIAVNAPGNANQMAFISDFNTAQGDALDVSDLLSGYNSSIHDLSDFVNVAQGAHTTIQIDRDGAGNAFGWSNIVRLVNNTTIDTDADLLVSSGSLIV